MGGKWEESLSLGWFFSARGGWSNVEPLFGTALINSTRYLIAQKRPRFGWEWKWSSAGKGWGGGGTTRSCERQRGITQIVFCLQKQIFKASIY